MKFNINNRVRVKVTDYGKQILETQHNELMKMLPREARWTFKLMKDSEGWTEFQLWDLMNRIGPHCYMGTIPPIETEIDLII